MYPLRDSSGAVDYFRLLNPACPGREALRAVVEHVVPGRWPDARQPNVKELAQTLVLALPIEEASAKRREGGPVDDEEDLSHPAWAGVVPLRLAPGEPQPDAAHATSAPAPAYAIDYRRP